MFLDLECHNPALERTPWVGTSIFLDQEMMVAQQTKQKD
jgi:hypothetical protein